MAVDFFLPIAFSIFYLSIGNLSFLKVMNGTSDIDVVRLRTYAWRHTIPSVHRLQMYKYMLGISGAYPETRDVVAHHRRDEVIKMFSFPYS